MNDDSAPRYSQAEEVCNSASHIVGVVLTVAGTYILVLNSTTPARVIAALVYGAAIFSMFLASSLYHAVRDQEVKAAIRKADHAMIYFAIWGTYVPVLNAVTKPPESAIWYCGLGICAVVGAVSSFITLKHKYVSTAVYLVMGWASLLLLRNLWHAAKPVATYLLIGGGAAYSVGAAFYLIRKSFVHTVFHLFVLTGVILQYMAIRTLYS